MGCGSFEEEESVVGEGPADLERAWVKRGAPNLLDFAAFLGNHGNRM